MSGSMKPPLFRWAEQSVSSDAAERTVMEALSMWASPDPAEAARRLAAVQKHSPDEAMPESYWTDQSSRQFMNFFVWGHDQDFGCGQVRSGAMKRRHIEIVSELIAHGMLPADLRGKKILDVGCWSGGDVLILAGLGGDVLAVEEHPKSAASAANMFQTVGCPARVVNHSLFKDDPALANTFDLVYCSGVVYHVTDPLLLFRIAFAYLKPGGSLIIETKASASTDATCLYSGTAEMGWNWYSPTAETLGRWYADAGFDRTTTVIRRREMGRLLGVSTRRGPAALPEPAGFSRPGSWLEGVT